MTAYRLTVDRVLGIEYAELTLRSGEVLEVVGPNASGKTSIASAAQAVLARDMNPLGLPAPEARRCYPQNEAEEAAVHLETQDGIAHNDVTWHPARQTMDAPAGDPVSVPEAVGLVDFRARKSAKERAEALQHTLLPPPSEVMKAVRAKLAEYLDDTQLNGAMETLAEQGWARTEGIYAERATAAKRQWQDVTGKNYGTKVSVDWHPDGWHADWDSLTVALAEERVVEARDALAVINAEQAITQAEADAAAAAEQRLPELRKAVEAAEAKLAGIETEIDDIDVGAAHRALRDANHTVMQADSRLAELRNAEAVAMACPHCSERVVYADGTLRAFDDDTHAELVQGATEARDSARDAATAAQTDYDDRQGRVGPLTDRGRAAQSEIEDARVAVRAAEREAGRSGVVDSAERQEQQARAEQALEDAKEVRDSVSRYTRAKSLHETVVLYTDVAKALGPQGVRAKMLDAGLKRLNAGLDVLADTAGWPVVVMSPEGAMTWGGRPVALCSESEQWRAQACVQLTLGAIAGSGVVVLDRADLLDVRNREGLVAALGRVAERTGTAVLLCTTGAPQPNAPWPQIEIHDGRVKGTP